MYAHAFPIPYTQQKTINNILYPTYRPGNRGGLTFLPVQFEHLTKDRKVLLISVVELSMHSAKYWQ